MTEDEDSTQEIVGYRNPPLASRFRKGQSGNHKGVRAVDGGSQLIKLGLDGDSAAARAAIAAIGDTRDTDFSGPYVLNIIRVIVDHHAVRCEPTFPGL